MIPAAEYRLETTDNIAGYDSLAWDSNHNRSECFFRKSPPRTWLPPVDRVLLSWEQLLHLAEADAAVVAGLPAAFDGNQTHVKRATGIPLAIAESCLHVLEAVTVVTVGGKKTVLPDVKSGVFFAEAALRAALFTVRTNVGYLDNPSFVAKMNQQTDEIEASAENMLDEIRPKLTI